MSTTPWMRVLPCVSRVAAACRANASRSKSTCCNRMYTYIASFPYLMAARRRRRWLSRESGSGNARRRGGAAHDADLGLVAAAGAGRQPGLAVERAGDRDT